MSCFTAYLCSIIYAKDMKQNRLKQNLKRQGSLAGRVHGGPVSTSSMLISVRYKAAELFVGGTYLVKTLQTVFFAGILE